MDKAAEAITTTRHQFGGNPAQKRPTTAAMKPSPASPAIMGVIALPDCAGSPPTKPSHDLESAANGQYNNAFPSFAGANEVRLKWAETSNRTRTSQRMFSL